MFKLMNSYLAAVMHVLAMSGGIEDPFTIRTVDEKGDKEESDAVCLTIMRGFNNEAGIASQLVDLVANTGDHVVYAIAQGEEVCGYVWVWVDINGNIDRVYAYATPDG